MIKEALPAPNKDWCATCISNMHMASLSYGFLIVYAAQINIATFILLILTDYNWKISYHHDQYLPKQLSKLRIGQNIHSVKKGDILGNITIILEISNIHTYFPFVFDTLKWLNV